MKVFFVSQVSIVYKLNACAYDCFTKDSICKCHRYYILLLYVLLVCQVINTSVLFYADCVFFSLILL